MGDRPHNKEYKSKLYKGQQLKADGVRQGRTYRKSAKPTTKTIRRSTGVKNLDEMHKLN